MLLKDINPYVRIAISGVLTAHHGQETFKVLSTPDCRLFLITSGGGEFVINGQTHRISEHSCILFQSGTEYVWRPDEKTGISYYAVNFDYTQNFSHISRSFHPRSVSESQNYNSFENICFEDADSLNRPIIIDNALSVEDRLRTIVLEYCIKNKFCGELLSSLLKSIIISIVRQNAENSENYESIKPFEIREIIDYIQKNYRSNISNEIIAEKFKFNPSYLSRKFKKYMGVSLHSFIVNYRINTAAEILRTQNITASELISLVGFSDVYHFSKCFKKIMGVSPSEYRKK